MKSLETTAANFQHLSQVQKRLGMPGDTARKPDAEALREAAEDFEALFVRQLLATMRRTVPEGDAELRGPGMDIYEGMLDAQFAEHIAGSGRGLGLADMLMRQFEKAGMSHED